MFKVLGSDSVASRVSKKSTENTCKVRGNLYFYFYRYVLEGTCMFCGTCMFYMYILESRFPEVPGSGRLPRSFNPCALTGTWEHAPDLATKRLPHPIPRT